ncbi:hypothetical protein EHS25_001773 [Saitozyma podzolica]|uniref:Uncharacterized protein n=1 Tax=Saitozyma podzolica TaxID=1890683 RepID=A0A427YFM7_9TREE|nr:hypothetical protein EHS25_001773 [Saitozyma podzolica]
MTTAEADAYREELIRNLTEQGFDEHRLFENSFDDITDFNKPRDIFQTDREYTPSVTMGLQSLRASLASFSIIP